MDVLIVRPNSQKRTYGVLSEYGYTAIEPPLWPAILAGYLRDAGYGVGILDAEAENFDTDETVRAIADASPRLVMVSVCGHNPSASTMSMPAVAHCCKRLREEYPQMLVCMHGLHPSALPEETLRETGAALLCQGEGFFTLPPLLDVLRSSSPDLAHADIPGLWRQIDGAILEPKGGGALHDELGALPMPAWDLLPKEAYRAHHWHCFDNIHARQPYAVLYTSLGCPFRCDFCCINALFGKNTIRYRSAESVLAEVDWLVREWGVRNIKLIDEMFLMHKPHVEAVCEGLAERNYDLNIWAYARVNTVTPKMLEQARRAGIRWLSYGFESASERVLAATHKDYDPNRTMEVVRQTREAGIYLLANYIFGLPEDDYESMQASLDQAISINAEWANLYCAMAYPGSKLYDDARRENLPLPTRWTQYSQYAPDSLPLPTSYLSSQQVLRFRDYAFGAYYRNPRYEDHIRDVFGDDTLAYIRAMAAKELPRDYRKPVAGKDC